MKPCVQARPRWENYLYFPPDRSPDFWKKHLVHRERDVLVMLGWGFDPRMCSGIRMILNAGGTGKHDCLLLRYEEGRDSPSMRYASHVDDNRRTLDRLMQNRGEIQSECFPCWTADGAYVGSRRAVNHVGQELIRSYTDVVIDVSAMPRGIYLPILGRTLQIVDGPEISEAPRVNIHVMVSEDVKLDEQTREKSIEKDASYLYGFSSDLWEDSSSNVPRVWIPILGEGKMEQLRKIWELVKPDEICPVLPSPSKDPRRSDNLIIQYRRLLFDEFRVEPRNIMYACEWNPFEAYRQIRGAIVQYAEALGQLGGCKAVVSSTSSKLLSIGVLLAAYECKYNMNYRVGIAEAHSRGYDMPKLGPTYDGETPYSLWLAGECYNE